jgi:TonB-linked SusC/RagA family outer membrane protein
MLLIFRGKALFWWKPLPVQLLRIMRLTAALLSIAALHVSAGVRGQKVTLTVRQAPLAIVFNEISRQTGISVMYDEELLKESRPVSLSVKDASVDEVMQACLKDQPFGYNLVNGAIVIKQKDPPLTPVQNPTPPGEIRGRVIDSLGNPLAGASIIVKGSKQGTKTDATGFFVLAGVQDNAMLIATYTGFQSREMTVNRKGMMTIVLSRSNSPLDQVQIIAYGTQTQRFSVGSVATVSSTEIEQQPVTNPLLALQGRAPGLNIVSTNGAPGAAVLVQIRGQNTLSSTPPNAQTMPFDQPLFIVDGVPFAAQNQNINQSQSLATPINVAMGNPRSGISPFNSINPADIESITILKDADATSIYGTQGSNGVILITTKRGKAGKAKFNVNVNSGDNVATANVKMMNTQQYLGMRTEALQNDSLTVSSNANDPGYAPDLTLFDQHKYTNWYKYFEGGMANTTNTLLSLSGGSASDVFYLSTGYTHSSYNFPGDFADNRLSLHSLFHHQSANQRLYIEFGTDYSYDENNTSGEPQVLTAFTLPPNYPDLIDNQGNLVWNYNGFDLGGYTNYLNGVGNPLAYLKETEKLNNYNLNTHLSLSFRLAPGLSIGSTLGYSKLNTQENSAFPLSTFDPSLGQQSYAVFATTNFETVDISPQINYSKHLLNGELKALVGGEYKQNITSSTNAQGNDYSNDALLGSINGAGSAYANDTYAMYKYAAVFARLGYIWNRKYIISLTGRRDGSSNFGPGKQYGDFGSVGAGWILSEESFMKALRFLSFTKLSGSYGTTGGDGITPYQYQPNWTPNTYENYQGIRPYYAQNLFNPDYSWSLTKKLNIGADLGFLKDRFLLNVTFYQDRISKQLINTNLSDQTGFSGVLQNFAATVQNRGWEFSVNSKNINTAHFTWTSTFNLSGNVNKLLAFPGLQTSAYDYTYKIGRSVNEQYAWKSTGVDPATGVFQFLGTDGKPTITPTFRTSASSLNDQYLMENPDPTYFGGLGNTFTYRAFSLTVFLQGARQKGNNYLFSVYSNWTPGVFGINAPVQLLNVWHQPGDQAGLQKYSTAAANQDAYNAAYYFRYSSGAWGDASYIRVKTISLSYSLSAAALKKLALQGANIYVNAQNLFTLTAYKVGDPETQTLYGFPMQRTIVGGINLTF